MGEAVHYTIAHMGDGLDGWAFCFLESFMFGSVQILNSQFRPLRVSIWVQIPLWIGLATTTGGLAARAQEQQPERWLPLIEQAESELARERIPSATPLRQQAEIKLKNLDSLLATSPVHGPRWRAILKVDSAIAEIAKPEPTVAVLFEVEKRFRQNYPGLESAPFAQARDALANYAYLQLLAANPDGTLNNHRSRLQDLAQQARKPEEFNKDDFVFSLGQAVLLLKRSNQATSFVTAVRNAYSSPNARVLIGSGFVEKRFARPVNEVNDINESILGTAIRGQGFLNGSVTPTLLDNPMQASLGLELFANFSSNNRGYNRSVVLNSTGEAEIAAYQSVALTESGLVSLGDAQADADLRTRINSIQHRSHLVRKIASKQAAKRKPEAEAISVSRLENRVRRQFQEQLSSRLSQANANLRDAARLEFARLGIDKPPRSSWSTRDCLALQWNARTDTQLSAPGPCPWPAPIEGITIQVHQSLVGNMLEPILAQRVIRNDDIDGYLSQFGDAAKNIQRNEDEVDWFITLQLFQPVEIRFDDSLIRFRVRTRRSARGDQRVDSAVVDAAYRVEISDNRIQLHREGDVAITLGAEQKQTGVEATNKRSVLRGRFEAIFRPELFNEPINLTEKLPTQFQDLQIKEWTIDEGWLQVHLN